MSKSHEEMSIKELHEEYKRDGTDNYSLATYISEREAKAVGKGPDTPYDPKTEHGEGVQGPR